MFIAFSGSTGGTHPPTPPAPSLTESLSKAISPWLPRGRRQSLCEYHFHIRKEALHTQPTSRATLSSMSGQLVQVASVLCSFTLLLGVCVCAVLGQGANVLFRHLQRPCGLWSPLELGEGSLMACYHFSFLLSLLLGQSRRPGSLLWAGGR